MARKITTTTRKAASKAATLNPHALAFARLIAALRETKAAIAEVQALPADGYEEDADAWDLVREVADGLAYPNQHGIWDLGGIECGPFLDAVLQSQGITREQWLRQFSAKKGS